MPLSHDHFQRVAKAIVEPSRCDMLRRIYAGGETVSCRITFTGLPICAAAGSRHLRELEQARVDRSSQAKPPLLAYPAP